MKVIFLPIKALFSFLNKNRHFYMLLYAAIYIPWFSYVEKKVSVSSNYHLIHMAIDDYIPFCEFFVIPYYLWFVYMTFAIIYIGFNDAPTCWKMGVFLITGMSVFLIVSTVYPNGQNLRPDTFARDNFCVDLVKTLYESDTPTNLFPSIHVYNSIGVHAALLHCDKLAKLPKWRWVRPTSWVLMISIILSTVLLKQHSMFDVLTGLALAGAMYGFCYGRPFAYIRNAYRRRHPLS